jgi:hypothetical protein
VRDQVSCPHKTTGKIIIFYNLFFKFLEDGKMEASIPLSLICQLDIVAVNINTNCSATLCELQCFLSNDSYLYKISDAMVQ